MSPRTPADAKKFGDAPYAVIVPEGLTGAAGEPLDGAYAPDEAFEPESDSAPGSSSTAARSAASAVTPAATGQPG